MLGSIVATSVIYTQATMKQYPDILNIGFCISTECVFGIYR